MEIHLVMNQGIRLGTVMTRFKVIEISSTEGGISGIRIQITMRVRAASEKNVMAIRQKQKSSIMFWMTKKGKSK